MVTLRPRVDTATDEALRRIKPILEQFPQNMQRQTILDNIRQATQIDRSGRPYTDHQYGHWYPVGKEGIRVNMVEDGMVAFNASTETIRIMFGQPNTGQTPEIEDPEDGHDRTTAEAWALTDGLMWVYLFRDNHPNYVPRFQAFSCQPSDSDSLWCVAGEANWVPDAFVDWLDGYLSRQQLEQAKAQAHQEDRRAEAMADIEDRKIDEAVERAVQKVGQAGIEGMTASELSKEFNYRNDYRNKIGKPGIARALETGRLRRTGNRLYLAGP